MAHAGTWSIIVSMEIYGSTGNYYIYSSVSIEDGLNYGGNGAQGSLALGVKSLQAGGYSEAGTVTKNLTLASYWLNPNTGVWMTTPTGGNYAITGASLIANIIRTYR